MSDTTTLLAHRSTTLREALERLQRTGKGVLLLIDDQGRLLRTVTDGDVRRLLLSGYAMHDALSALPDQAPVVVGSEASEVDALAVMNAQQVDQLPMVDASQRPVRVLQRRDLDSRILLSTPHMGEYEMGYVEEAFRTNWVAPLGPNVEAFERELARHVGVGHAAAVSSGTAAIHLALVLLRAGPGDVVFCSSLTFVASANPILYVGATPVFIDSDPATWNMSVNALARALEDAARKGRPPKAVIVVNLYGQSADMDLINALCERYEVPVIEDAAESLGATYKGRHSGTSGRVGVYSFNGNKIITTSGGGMLLANEEALVVRARSLATQAREAVPHYEHTEIGYNYRMSNVLAGIGRGQLHVLDKRVDARREIFRRYAESLADISELEWMPEAPFGRSTRWLSVCALSGASPGAVEMIRSLGESGIEARRVWKPMHLQPLYRGAPYYRHAEHLDTAADLFDRGVCLPSGSNMSEAQQDRIIQAIRRALGRGVHAAVARG